VGGGVGDIRCIHLQAGIFRKHTLQSVRPEFPSVDWMPKEYPIYTAGLAHVKSKPGAFMQE